MNKAFKRTLGFIIATVMMLSQLQTFAAAADRADWAVYVYLCGSDLESNYGKATIDILEMLQADFSDNVKLIVMTGGAMKWDPKLVGESYNKAVGYDAYITPDAEHNQIYEISDGRMTLLKTYDEYMSMSDSQTAKEFMEDAFKYAPADHILIDFWDHGGAIMGAERDAYDSKFLSVEDIADVIKTAEGLNDGKKIDLVGFDACLMSSLEMGSVLSPYADYLVGSEEVEPGEGWCYIFLSMFGAAKKVPSAVEVGKNIIDYYAYSQNPAGDWSKSTSCTMALTDLSQMGRLVSAFDELAKDMVSTMEDERDFTELMRVAEETKAMTYPCTIDMYDFLYRLSSVDSISASAQKVIDVLGMPPGSDDENYDGHVDSDNYLGWTLGDKPAVLYRGVGANYNKCLGLNIFYPLLNAKNYGFNSSDYINIYNNFDISEDYKSYMMSVNELSDAVSLFNGQLKTDYDGENEIFSMSVQPADNLNMFKKINYITTLTQIEENGKRRSYMLGSEAISDGWKENKFARAPYEEWYTLNGKLITVNTESCYDRLDLNGVAMYNYKIPVGLIDENGEEMIAILSCTYYYAPDITAVTGVEDTPFDYYNKMLISEITPLSEDGVAQRSFDAEDGIKIKPAIAVYDMDGRSTVGYMVYGDEVDLTKVLDCYALPCEMTPLVSNGTTYYAAYYEATDIQDEVYLSAPFEYDLITSFDEFRIDNIIPQAYTGATVEPKVRLLYQDQDLFVEGLEYKVTYSNNIEKGKAEVTVTSLMEDLPGELKAEFEICDADEAADRAVKLLPEHDVMTDCVEDSEYEYLGHIYMLEDIKCYYERGYSFSEDSLRVFKDQYDKVLKALNLSLKDNNTELMSEYGSFNSDIDLSLTAQSKLPTTGGAATALKSIDTSELIDSLELSVYTSGKDEQPDRLDIIDGAYVVVKIAIDSDVDENRLRLYRLTEDSDTATRLACEVVEREGERYVIFDTDKLGYFVLFESDIDFYDVPSNAWYAGSVKYVVQNGLMSGVGNDKFAPNATLTRAMLATVLYNMDGEPEISEMSDFKDVADNAYYAAAVAWARENDIVAGYSEDRFEPNKDITREQLASILWRYAKYKGADVSAEESASIDSFKDANKVSQYAVTAMKWAYGAGIISGIDGALVSNGGATRAQLASILERMSNS